MKIALTNIVNLHQKCQKYAKKPSVKQFTNMSKNQLRKAISKKVTNNSSLKRKHSKYFKRIKNGELGMLINQKQLECPICLEVMINPTMQTCGHTYCFKCLTANEAHRKRCCICRQEQESELHLPSTFAETLINNYLLPNYNHKDLIKYLVRSSDSAEWLKRRKINNLREGLIIDFYDGFNVWRKAIVSKIFVGQNQKNMAEVKFLVRGDEFMDTVQITSSRLAPYAFFTRGRYLLQFAPTLPAPEIDEGQLFGLQYKSVLDADQFFRPTTMSNITEEPVEEREQQNPQGSLLEQALSMLNYCPVQQFQLAG